jgi:NAD+ kinase
MAVIGMILHHERAQAAELARDAVEWLVERGHEVRLPLRDAGIADLAGHGCAEEGFGRGLDLAVSLGGDGTMLRTVDLVAAEGVPVVGVNVGQLGYLTEVEPPGCGWRSSASWPGPTRSRSACCSGHDRRPGFEPFTDASGAAGHDASHQRRRSFVALNEAVLEKTPMGHTVRLGVSIDGETFTPYAADGLIVATPTGSTAYAFSARGPIVEPTHRCLLMTPVSPHMLFDRSLVLDPSASSHRGRGDRPATLSVDGHNLGMLKRPTP